MAAFKISIRRLFTWGYAASLALSVFSPLEGLTTLYGEGGRILFLIQQGRPQQAFDLYKDHYKSSKIHDYDLVHKMGLAMLDYGFRQRDPEIQLMALFGASVSAHDDAFYIMEEALRSRHPQLQLVALSTLSKLQSEKVDKALTRAMASPYPIIRLEAAHQLCIRKHPHAVGQTEALMYKTPKEMLPLYPQLFAIVGTPEAIKYLRKSFNDSSEKVRLAAILSTAKYGRDDLLPHIRQLALQFHYAQQEACAYALGLFKDNKSYTDLMRLARSHYPQVSLAAKQALYQLGRHEVAKDIEASAREGDLFAIAALGETEESAALIYLLNHSDAQIRLNATLALLKQHHAACLPYLKDILIRDHRDIAYAKTTSPGQAFEIWKIVSSANLLLKDDLSAYATNLEFKEDILEEVRQFSDRGFLTLADQLLETQQNELVPTIVEGLEDINSEESIAVLKKHQQKLGAPLIRNYCNLALYRLHERGPYGEQLRQWVQSQKGEDMIRFRPMSPWNVGDKHYELTPEEKSRLLIESFEAFAAQQDDLGIEILIESVRKGNEKNKYALAGLLLRATQ